MNSLKDWSDAIQNISEESRLNELRQADDMALEHERILSELHTYSSEKFVELYQEAVSRGYASVHKMKHKAIFCEALTAELLKRMA